MQACTWLPCAGGWRRHGFLCSLGKLLKDLVCVSPPQADDQIRTCYEHTMAEWLGCEAIVRQREKESHAAALAKCSSGASLDSHIQRMMHRDSTISNEVRLRGLREGCPHAGTWALCQPVLQGETGRNGDSSCLSSFPDLCLPPCLATHSLCRWD